jgi:P4 family phage/plasmid primase-like protien
VISLNDFLAENNIGNTGQIIFDSKIHRFRPFGRSDKSGWYVAHKIGELEIFVGGDWASGITYKWHSKTGIKKSEIDREIKRLMHLQAEQREKSAREAIKKARYLLDHRIDKPAAEIPYLAKKKISTNYAGFIDAGESEYLGIPIYDTNFELQSMQKIYANGKKMFIAGGKLQGNFFGIDKFQIKHTDTVYICEGFATASTIHDLTGKPVVVAFMANNLKPVAQNIKQMVSPDAKIIIVADNDQFTDKPVKNPGLFYAKQAADTIGAEVTLPEFKDTTNKPTDFNDLFCIEGRDECLRQLGITKPADDDNNFYDCPTKENGFYFIELNEQGKEVKKPDYYGLADYLHQKYHLKADSSKSYFYKNNYFKPICKNGLISLIIQETKRRAIPSHFDNFIKTTLGRAHTDMAKFLPAKSKINFQNGVFDIATGKLVPHHHKYNFTYLIRHDYERTYECPQFMEFLNFIFEGNQELIDLTFEIYGYCIAGGEPWLHKAFLLYGEGRNGKSTWLEVLSDILGKQNTSMVSMGKIDKPFSAVQLDGKLANISEESPTRLVDNEAFKIAVGGGYLTAAQKGKPEYDLKVDARLLFACNKLPKFGDTTAGMHEKLYIIPFTRFITLDERIPNFKEELLKERSGILNRSIDGFKKLQARMRLPEIDVVGEMLNQYRLESDSVYQWAIECTEIVAGNEYAYTKTSDLYTAYMRFFEHDKRHTVNKIEFSRRFASVQKQRCICTDLAYDALYHRRGWRFTRLTASQ